MKKIATLFFMVLSSFAIAYAYEGGTLTLTSNPIVPNRSVTINYDGTGTNFANWTPQCFVHVWLVPKSGQIFSGNYAPAWTTCNSEQEYAAIESKYKMTYSGTAGKYSIDIPNLYTFFGVSDEDKPKVGQFGVIVRAQYSGANNQTNNFVLNVADSAKLTPPTIISASGATVDAVFDVTFTDDEAWRNAITAITIEGATIDPLAYNKTVAGRIMFTPSASSLLKVSGIKEIVVVASGYNNDTISQTIGVGVASKLAITTQPTAPTSNGAMLANQPVVVIQDQYGNLTSSTASVLARKGDAGTWTLDGTAYATAIAGTATFTNLTAASTTAVSGATLIFTSLGLASVSSESFTIPAPNMVDWANLQWPASGAISLGAEFNVYSWVYEPTITNSVGKGDGIQVWIGYNSQDTDPSTWTNWILSTYDSDQNGTSNDQYVANLGTAITSEGTYYYASRIQLGNAAYQYGGYSGGFWDNVNNKSGVITVSAVTGIETLSENEAKVWVQGRTINAKFKGTAQVELFNTNGQLVHSSKAMNLFSETVDAGLYILKLNGKTHKVFTK